MIPAAMNDALDQTRGDVADREELVLPPHDRVDHDGCADVRDDQQELEEHAEVDLVVLTAAGDVPGWIVENRLDRARVPVST